MLRYYVPLRVVSSLRHRVSVWVWVSDFSTPVNSVYPSVCVSVSVIASWVKRTCGSSFASVDVRRVRATSDGLSSSWYGKEVVHLHRSGSGDYSGDPRVTIILSFDRGLGRRALSC